MAKKKETKQPDVNELMREMRTKGIEQVIPGTERHIRLRSVDAPTLLREGKMPDMLTPLVIKSVYQELSDKELRDFLGHARSGAEEALKMLDTIDFVAKTAIADGTKVEDLTLAEKRWIFRLVMGPAELLISFRYDPNADVESVDEGEELQPASE